MAECKNCGEWCNDRYEYCWNCNQQEIEQDCPICGRPYYAERWKNVCKQCYFDELNDEGYYIPKKRKEKLIANPDQTKLDKFF